MAFELRKFVTAEFVFGQGAINLIGQYSVNFNVRKALIVTDPGIIKAGWLRLVEISLKEKNIPYVIFQDVTPNPKDFEIENGVKLFKKENCDFIIAVGGGSPIDCAKGIGISCTNNKYVNDFEGIDEVKVPMPPLFCIPTTAGTSADISQFAIVVNSHEKRKLAIVSKAVIPDISLIDPVTTTTMNSALTAATGFDALVHAFEAYVSNASSPITDLHALEAVRLIYGNIEKAVKEPLNLEIRDLMMLGSLHAGLAFSNASLGLVHAMAHSVGGYFDTAHGETNAILLEAVIDFNFDYCTEKYILLGEAMGLNLNKMSNLEKKNSIIKNIQNLRKGLGIDFTLTDIGVKKEDLKSLAKNAFYDVCLVTNPKEISVDQIKELYEKYL